MCEASTRAAMTERSASRGFLYTSPPGTESTETTEPTADSVADSSRPATADD
jgi:hypothetical protein